jgi:high-affinity Fe2+/Pb2+ permease
MGVVDTIYRFFMFILPYSVCFAAYIWIGQKAWRVPQKASRVIALFIIAAGLGYTLYRLVGSIGTYATNDNFEYIIIIVAVALLALASIVMAIGEPEEERTKKEGTQQAKEAESNNGLNS